MRNFKNYPCSLQQTTMAGYQIYAPLSPMVANLLTTDFLHGLQQTFVAGYQIYAPLSPTIANLHQSMVGTSHAGDGKLPSFCFATSSHKLRPVGIDPENIELNETCFPQLCYSSCLIINPFHVM